MIHMDDVRAMTTHRAITEVLSFFDYAHLPPHLQEVSRGCHDLAVSMVDSLPHHAELTVALRALLIAKDAFVRAKILGDRTGDERAVS